MRLPKNAAALLVLGILLLAGAADCAEKKRKKYKKIRRSDSILAVRGLVETKSIQRDERDYGAVDRLARFAPSPEEVDRFRKEGGLP